MSRPLRDRLAEAMRRARLGGLVRTTWERISEEAQEEWRLAADHVLRLSTELGLSIAIDGDGKAEPPSDSPVIWRSCAAGANAERIVRGGDDGWGLVVLSGGEEERIMGTTLEEVATIANLALVGDPKCNERGNLTRLSMGFVVLQLDAARTAGDKS